MSSSASPAALPIWTVAVRVLPILALAAGLAGCTPFAPPPATPAARPPVAEPLPAPVPEPQPDLAPQTASQAQADPAALARQALVRQPLQGVLDYADLVRAMNNAQIGREINRLGPLAEQPDLEVQPQYQLQLALALAQTRNLPDLVRAIGLAQRAQEADTPGARQLQPLARLLQQRLTEQRRLEETNERQSQLLRDAQRRLDTALERMEALKAIERSLSNSRNAPGGPPPFAPGP